MLAPAARAKLHAALTDAGARDAYWASLGRFLRFELAKADFDKLALAALGPHVGLHNDLILALLKDAQQGAPPETAVPEPAPTAASTSASASASATPMDVDAPTGAPPLPRGFAPPAPGAQPASGLAPGGGGASATGGAGAGLPPPGLQRESSSASAGGAPKLMLKISADRQSASAQRVELTVDRAEEAQLNALHDRLLELTRAYEPPAGRPRLQAVQPEAVSLMARALKVVSNRLIVAAVLGSGAAEDVEADGSGAPAARPATRVVGAEDVYDAIRQPAPAPWMAPPSQRAGSTLSAFANFVP